MSAPHSILIVRLGAMGDIIHAMPAVAALRKAFPATKFGWIVEKRWAELPSDAVDVTHVVDTRRWRRALLAKPTRSEFRHARREIREGRYDIAIDFQGAVKSALFAKLSRAPRIYGFAKPWEWPAAYFYNEKVSTDSVHVVDQTLDLAAAIVRQESGAEIVRDATAQIPSDAAAEFAAAEKLRQAGITGLFAVLNPGTGWGAKQWPAERYAKVARVLGEGGIRSLVNFGPGEQALAEIVQEQGGGYAIAAQFTISELIAVTRRAALFIGGDTGPLHLAAALKVPVVALFGPTDPVRTGPYGTRSIVLRDPSSVTSHKRNRETEAGLMNISAEQAIAAARELLNTGARA